MLISSIGNIFNLQSALADDLNNYSPNESALNHILIYSNHGIVKKVTLGVYYSTALTKSFNVNIIGKSGSDCRVDVKALNGELATVSWDGEKKASWQRNQNDLCNNRNGPNDQGDDQTLQDGQTNSKSFLVSPAKGVPVAGTSLKRSVVTIALTDNATGYKPNEPGKDKNDDTKFTFKVSSDVGKIGNIDTSSSNADPNNSILARQGESGYKSAQYGFGFPCNVTTASEQTLTVYDADNGTGNQPKPLYYHIDSLQNGAWHRVSVKSTSPGDGIDNNTVTPRSAGDSNIVSSVAFRMEPRMKYRLIVDNMWANKHNYIYVGMPGDSIFGDSSVQCQAADLDPSDTVTIGNVGDSKMYSNISTPVRAYPGQTITFQHPVTNKGDGVITSNTSFSQSGSSAPWSSSPSARSIAYNPNTTTPIPGGQHIAITSDIGKTLCEKITVNPYQYSGGSKTSAGLCVYIVTPAQFPTTHINGYDVQSGGDIVTRSQPIDYDQNAGKEFGSWAEYGSFSTGKNQGFASASALNKGSSTTERNKLTFANTGNCGGNDGCYGLIDNPASTIKGLESRCASIEPNDMLLSTVLNANGGNIPVSSTQFECSKGTVTIDKDINYSGGNTNKAESLPQLVIIAKNILIKDNVKNIDAWLIAKPSGASGGRISTCEKINKGAGIDEHYRSFSELSDFGNNVDGPGIGLKAASCPEPLTINGPVIANSIYLYRTAPVNSDDQFAERFNLRADAFLWAYNGGSSADSTPVAQTTSIQELPPRF